MMADEFHAVNLTGLAVTPARSLAYFLSIAGHFLDLSIFQGNRPFYKDPRDDPDEWKKQHAQQQPGEGESADPRGHEVGREIIEQGQGQQGGQERSGAG